MVKHTVFGVERDIDIHSSDFPTEAERRDMEDRFPVPCRHGWFDSTSTNPPKKLHYRCFLPPTSTNNSNNNDNDTTTTTKQQQQSDPKAIIIWMHGIQTHSGRAHVLTSGRTINMALLCEQIVVKHQYALYCFDMMGHGYSEGNRFLVTHPHVKQDYLNFVQLVQNEHYHHHHQQQQQHDNKNNNNNNNNNNSNNNNSNNSYTPATIPLFLMGESFGANLTLQVARHYQDYPLEAPRGFRGIVLLAAAVYGYQLFFPIDKILKYVLVPLLPRFRPPTFVPNPVAPELLWRDPAVLYVNAQEQRVTEMWFEPGRRHTNLQTSSTLIEAMKLVRQECIPNFRVPFCIVHGTKDRAVPIHESLDYFVQHADTLEHDRAVLRVDGAYHDLLGDPTAEDTVQFCLEWIQQRIKGFSS